MRLLRAEPQKKLKKKYLSRGGNYFALCWGGKMKQAFLSSLAT